MINSFLKKHPCYIVIFLMGITNFYHLSILNLIFVIIPIGYMVNIYKNISYLLPTTDPDINNSNIEALSYFFLVLSGYINDFQFEFCANTVQYRLTNIK